MSNIGAKYKNGTCWEAKYLRHSQAVADANGSKNSLSGVSQLITRQQLISCSFVNVGSRAITTLPDSCVAKKEGIAMLFVP